MASQATAIIFPPRENMRAAVEEAMSNRPAKAELATDGKCVAWLPRITPGWFAINSAVFKVAA